MKTAIAVVLLVLVQAGLASADVLYPNAITFGPAYAIAAGAGFPFGFAPDFGSPLFIAGMVTGVNAPFNDLVPAGPHEITWVAMGATYQGYGIWDDMTCGRSGTDYAYYGGSVIFYLDTTPDADFTNPSSFQDGDPVLVGQMQGIHLTNDDPDGICLTENYPDALMSFSLKGGTWFYRVSSGAVSFGKGEIPGSYPDMIPPELRATGYLLRIDGSMDIVGPVATEPTTWGRVKSLYR